MSKEQCSILIVEDEPLTALAMKTRLQMKGHNVIGSATTGEEAFSLSRNHKPDIVLLDLSLAGKANGLDVARRIKQQLPSISIVFLTANSQPEILKEMKEISPAAVIQKPMIQDYQIEIDGKIIHI